MQGSKVTYERRRPERTTLYEVVRDNVETLYAAMEDNERVIPKFVRKELEGYLDCGLLCRGFAQLECEGCSERRLVAFSCKGRGFCPSCMGRRMAQTAANLIEEVLPKAGLRQWVLTPAISNEASARVQCEVARRSDARVSEDGARVLREALGRERVHRGGAADELGPSVQPAHPRGVSGWWICQR